MNSITSILKSPDQLKKWLLIIAIVIAILIITGFAKDITAFLSNLLKGNIGGKQVNVDPSIQAQLDSLGKDALSVSSPWNATLYKNNPDASTMDYDELKSIAKNINNSISWWGILDNDVDAASTAMMQCQNQVDVSNLVQVFAEQYGKNLVDVLYAQFYASKGGLPLLNIMNYVKNLPTT